MTQLSHKALTDLKETLRKSYGEDFGNDLTDEEFEEIGMLLLTVLAEGLKLKAKNEQRK